MRGLISPKVKEGGNIPEGERGREWPKKSLDKVIREDLKVVGLMEDIAQNRRL